MALKDHTTREKILIILTMIIGLLFVPGILFLGSILMAEPIPEDRSSLLEYYSDTANYNEVTATIVEHDNGQTIFCYCNLYIEDEDKELPCLILRTNYDIATANGFSFEESDKNYVFTVIKTYEEEPVGVYAICGIRSQDGESIYLDLEDGKANLLYYVEYEKP